MKFKKEIDVRIPKVPNNIFDVKEDGGSYPLNEFSNEQLIEIADQWKKDLLARAGVMRKDANTHTRGE